jgi:FkbH-like protein
MLQELSWLPVAPENFRQLTRALKQSASASSNWPDIWDQLKRLAAFALDEVQLSQLRNILAGMPDHPGLPSRLKLGILGAGDGTLSFLGPAIAASAIRRDLRVEIVEGDYGTAMNEAMDPGSKMHGAKPDFLLVACDRRGLGLNRTRAAEADSKAAVEAAFGTIRSIVEGLRPSVKRGIMVQTVVPPMDPLFGSFDFTSGASPFAQVNALNTKLGEWAASGDIILVDVARLACSVGLERWDDQPEWYAAKHPFSTDLIPLYGDFVARTLAAALGKSRKCLVLDLDNTLWGGVIGDDGVGGIVLGHGTAAGEAFVAIQEMARDLRDRGIILAICSKNEPDAAVLPFREHSEMVLKESHIAAFQANWVDKAANLKAIAEGLNIGIDSLVFLDDNPAERAQVRAELPMVAVPELPDDPALYARTLLAAGYFDAVSFADEDRTRADDYQANAERAQLQAKASNLGEYLKSLEMVCTIRPFDAEGRARISQLINKSNQFNLTTRRYTEAEVATVEGDASKHHMQIHLIDRFGNNGMICVIIADKGADAWTIDTWLMSCRVLGRRVEEAALAHLAAAAKASGATRIIGQYIPTAKNKMVIDHYRKLGFRQTGRLDGGGVIWELSIAEYSFPDLEMQVEQNAPEIPVRKVVRRPELAAAS